MCQVSQYIIHLVLVIFLVSVIRIFHHFHDSQRGVEDYRNPSDKEFFYFLWADSPVLFPFFSNHCLN